MRQETHRLRPPRWPSGLVPWRSAVQSFLEKLSKAAKVQIEVQGATRSQSGEDLMLDLGTIPSGTATAQTPAQEAPSWPSGLVPWKMAVQAHAEKLAAAAGVQIEVFGTTRGQSGEQPALEVGNEFTGAGARSTASKKDASVPRWPTSHVGWCRALQRFIERLASALQTSLELGGVARSSGGDKLVFALKPPPPRNLILRLETQPQQAYAFYCASISDADGNFYSSVSTTEKWSEGEITYTTTQSETGPHFSTPTIPMFDCPGSVTEDDREPGKDYGFLEEVEEPEYTGGLSQSSLRPLALNNLEVIGDPDPGVAFAITADDEDDIIHAHAHGLDNGDRVMFPWLIGGTGLLDDRTFLGISYYVIDKTPNTFKVSQTEDGEEVDITSNITAGTCRKEEENLTAVFRTWAAKDTPPTNITHNLGYWDSGISGNVKTGFYAHSNRYRWTNDSDKNLRIQWKQGGITRTLTVPANDSSDWYDDELPAAQSEQDAITEVEITVL
jgi:hypothetical protein